MLRSHAENKMTKRKKSVKNVFNYTIDKIFIVTTGQLEIILSDVLEKMKGEKKEKNYLHNWENKNRCEFTNVTIILSVRRYLYICCIRIFAGAKKQKKKNNKTNESVADKKWKGRRRGCGKSETIYTFLVLDRCRWFMLI